MEITWYGLSCFRLKAKEGVAVTDPYRPHVGFTLPRLTADIVTISHDHPGHSNAKAVKGEPKVITVPGEYEINDIFIFGVPAFHDKRNGRDRGPNTVFVFKMEDLSVCHLGDIGHVPLQAQLDVMGTVDILLLPVGGANALAAAPAVETINVVEPKIVVPMHYKTPATSLKLDPLDKFTKEIGLKKVEAQPSLKISKAQLPEETQVVILDHKG